MTVYYESPEVIIALSKEEIHKRYQDTALVIFKVRSSQAESNNKLLIDKLLNCRSSKTKKNKW